MLQRNPDDLPSRLAAAAESKAVAYTVSFLVIPALLVLCIVLPPISLPERILDAGYRTAGRYGIDLTVNDGALLSVPPEAMTGGTTKLKFESISREDFAGGKAGEEMAKAAGVFPSNLDLKSPVYQIWVKGSMPTGAFFSAPLPVGAEAHMLDFYAWDGRRWEFVPGQFFDEDGAGETVLAGLPRAIVVAHSRAAPPTISASLAASTLAAVAGGGVPRAGPEGLVEVNPLGLVVRGDGSIGGEMAAVPLSQKYIVVPTFSNLEDGVARTDLATNMLTNDQARTAHVEAIGDFAVQNLLPGVDVHYESLKPELREYFTRFIAELAGELHARGKFLSVSVPQPVQVSEDEWDTGAYDWQALGQHVDGFRIAAMAAPEAYKPGGAMEQLLNWAVARVSRYKIQVTLETQALDRAGSQVVRRSPEHVLRSLLGKITVEGMSGEYAEPWQDIRLQVSTAPGFSGFVRDAVTGAYRFRYTDEAGREHTVFLETAESLTYKMGLAGRYNLKGVAFDGLLSPGADPAVWNAIAQYRQAAARASTQYELVWTVRDGKGQQIQVEKRGLTAGADTSFTWKAAPVPDRYTIGAAIASNSIGGAGETVALAVAIPTATPTPTRVPPTPTPRPVIAAPVATNTPRPASTTRAPASGGFFGYGIQADLLSVDANASLGHVNAIGFKWVKQQIEYKRYYPGPGQYDFSAMDRIVDAAQAHGLNMMFSIVKAPKWSRPAGDTDEGPPADLNTYADYVRAVAARYKGRVQAYEIWNEQNLYYEWGGLGGKISAARYMEMLRLAYAAIKSVDPDAIVISGAPTPTGMNDGNIAVDDQVYLRQMYESGLRNYSDAIGAHPSGFNCPADADWRTVEDPSATFRGPFDNRHPSWCFRATMEGYRNIMITYGDARKRIWVTEFGWASVDGLGVPPARGYEYAGDNTAQEQAAWVSRAYQIGRGNGYTGVMFLWNLNFAPVSGAADEKAAFGILDQNWGPRPVYHALAAMPK